MSEPTEYNTTYKLAKMINKSYSTILEDGTVENVIRLEPECGFLEVFKLSRTGKNERMNPYTGERVQLTNEAIVLHDLIKLKETVGEDYSNETEEFMKLYPKEYFKLLD